MPHIERLRKQAGDALAELERLCPPDRDAEVAIPLKVVRRTDEILADYTFVKNPTLRRNISYATQALDFYRWLIVRFGLYGSVESYVCKTGIILCNMIVEAMVQDLLRSAGIKPHDKHSRNINKLPDLGIDAEICKRMHSLRTRRENVHLHLVSDLEATKYKVTDWNLSISCLKDTRIALASFYKESHRSRPKLSVPFGPGPSL